MKFTFDECLVEDSAGKLLPNQLTVDNLTVEWLRTKLTDLEASIRENQERRIALTTNHDGLVNGKSNINNEVNNRLETKFLIFFIIPNHQFLSNIVSL